MIAHAFPDKSVGYEYEPGDFVSFIKNTSSRLDPKIGAWGIVNRVQDLDKSYHIRFIDILIKSNGDCRGSYSGYNSDTPPWCMEPFKLENFLSHC